jgi:hypothetical protein
LARQSSRPSRGARTRARQAGPIGPLGRGCAFLQKKPCTSTQTRHHHTYYSYSHPVCNQTLECSRLYHGEIPGLPYSHRRGGQRHNSATPSQLACYAQSEGPTTITGQTREGGWRLGTRRGITTYSTTVAAGVTQFMVAAGPFRRASVVARTTEGCRSNKGLP